MRLLKILTAFTFLILLAWGGSALYFALTDGFREDNIVISPSFLEIVYQKMASSEEEMNGAPSTELAQAIAQPYFYLGKGCQSYVFLSQDNQYVIKLFKYQRFKPSILQELISPFSLSQTYLQAKLDKKTTKLARAFQGYVNAYNYLKNETGLIYIHLKPSVSLFKSPLVIHDKMGYLHEINLNTHEFLVQKSAEMLTSYIQRQMAEGKEDEVKLFLTGMITDLIEEYKRGIADTDHALIQNTGVRDNHLVHIDVGQIVREESMKDKSIYEEEIFSKTYKFRFWLKERYPVLQQHLEMLLLDLMGERFYTLKPNLVSVPEQEF